MKSQKEVININDQELQSVMSRFEDWRKNCRELGRRSRIPEELWDLAVALTEKYAIGSVAKVLRLGYDDFKKRVQRQSLKGHDADADADASLNQLQSPSFVELKLSAPFGSPGLGSGSQGTQGSQCLMELSRADGTHMRIYSTAESSIDITRLCESFLKN